jgi:NADPH2:quinone reductase
MHATRIHETGGAEVMRYEEVPAPSPSEGQAVVRLAAAGVNFIDTYQRKGLYRLPLPAILGQEGAGVVEAVGPGVTAVKPGDRVAFANIMGAYSEYIVAPAERLVAVPDGMDLETAAAVILQGMTAHYLTHSTYPLKQGDVALVHAAAGGVGLLLIQVAKRRGATVIGTVSTEAKAELAREAGADHIILYTETDFEAETKRITNGKGAQVVYDSVGRDTFDRSLSSLVPRGMLVLFGQSSGPVAPLDPQVLNAKGSLFLTRPTLLHYTATRDELLWRANDVLGWVASGELKVRIDRTLPLEQAPQAHRALESRQTAGKVLLVT